MNNLGVAGTVAVVVLLLLGALFWFRSRSPGVAGWRGGRINLALGFPRTRRSGYLPADVDQLLDRAYGLSTDAEGRAEALELVHQAQFGLMRRGGYDPVVVDLHVDAMIVALQTGRELPVRPGTPRP